MMKSRIMTNTLMEEKVRESQRPVRTTGIAKTLARSAPVP